MPRTYVPTGKPRGRPKGSPNKPKTVEEYILRLATVRHAPKIPKPPKSPKTKSASWANTTAEERSARMAKVAAARTAKSFENVGRKKGVPHHTTKARHAAAKAAIADDIKRIIKIMQKNGELPEDLGVKVAVAALLEIIGGEETTSNRISAIKTFLEFHKTKPVQKTEVAVSPLQFLRDIPLEDEE